jgi:hypothetical protein
MENRALGDDKQFDTRQEVIQYMKDTKQFDTFWDRGFLSDDTYLQPVVPDDALLHSFAASCDDEDDEDHDGQADEDDEDQKPIVTTDEDLDDERRMLSHLCEVSDRIKAEDGIDIESLRNDDDATQ